MLSYRHEGLGDMHIYLNGEWVPEEEATVPFQDRGFQLGESLFETVRVNNAVPFRVAKHMDRLKSGMETIQLKSESVFDSIPVLVEEYINRNSINNALVRIMLTRGRAESLEPSIYISSRDIPHVESWPVKVMFMEERDYPILRFHPAIKSGNYLGNMLAKRDATEAGAFEPVFVNEEGYVTECAIRNIFFIRNNTLLTPTVELGVLPGVMRDTIMELASRIGMEVEEGYIRAERVDDMDEAFISSTGVDVLPVFWDGFQSRYEKSMELREALEDLFESGANDVS